VTVPGFCRDCDATLDPHRAEADRCPRCGSGRLLRHPELSSLTLAHIDCDAFYAAIEKRDDPSLRDKPLIIGGGRRGVVSTCCYIARRSGVRSAMPMFKARELCPEAVVLRPDMEKYAGVSRQVREIFLTATPQVEPVSLDEAYLDLEGTAALHGKGAALVLAGLARRIEREIGITVSIGLSYNRFLAKLASEMDKPRGFGVIGVAEARGYLAARPVRHLPGIGAKMAAYLEADGFATIAQLQAAAPGELERRYGAHGRRLAELAEGRDDRTVEPEREAKSVSAETTFESDLATTAALQDELWPLCERVAARAKHAEIAGRTIVLKLKTAEFRILTRRRQLPKPTQFAEAIYRVAQPLLAQEIAANSRRRFRLIGVGLTDLAPAAGHAEVDLFDSANEKRLEAVERAMDAVRAKFGDDSIRKGRGLRRAPARPPAPK
jgi:DNA polymerase IV